jgi:hypothetical protein
MLKQIRNKLITLRGRTQKATKDSTKALSLGISYNLRVEKSVLTVVEGIGLITFKKTLKLESIALVRSTGDRQTKLLRRLSSISKEDEQLTKFAKEVHLTNIYKGGYSLTNRV